MFLCCKLLPSHCNWETLWYKWKTVANNVTASDGIEFIWLYKDDDDIYHIKHILSGNFSKMYEVRKIRKEISHNSKKKIAVFK